MAMDACDAFEDRGERQCSVGSFTTLPQVELEVDFNSNNSIVNNMSDSWRWASPLHTYMYDIVAIFLLLNDKPDKLRRFRPSMLRILQ